jgi:surface antigen
MTSRTIGSVFAASLALAGCVSAPAVFGPLAAPVGSAGAPAPGSSGPAMVGWLGGPAGQGLEDADREAAFAAQLRAAETGQRASWRSARGHFGFVEPGPEAAGAAGPCRPFSHTLYIDGRAQRGEGRACRQADGAWAIVG